MVASYPYGERDRLSAAYVNHDLRTNPQPTPPASSNGGSYLFKQWIDISVYPAVLRMCTVARASPGYVAGEWLTLANIYHGGEHKVEWGPQGGYLPLTGGTITGSLRVTGNVSIDGSITKVWDVVSGGTVTSQFIHATVNLNAGQDLGVARDAYITRNTSIGGDLGVSGNIITALGLYGIYLQATNAYVPGGLTVGQNIALGNQLDCFNIVTSYETIHGNLAVGSNITSSTINCTNLAAGGNITTGTLNTTYLAAFGTGTSISASQDITAGRTIFSTGMQCQNILVNSPADIAVNIPGGGITAVRGLFGNHVSVGGGDVHALWVPFGSCSARSFHPTGANGYAEDFAIYIGSGVKIINYAPNCYWAWNMTNADLTYVTTPGVEFFQLQQGSKYVVNKQGPMQAWDYLYLSDRRSKTNIVPAEYGLEAVLALEPVKFNRHRASVEEDYPPAEIGFVAQDVAGIMPEAVRVAHVELPDGSGGPDSDDPLLSITLTPMIAAMIKAFKQINARLVALEGGTDGPDRA